MLAPGTRLGTYEVIGPLGAGGMGEVYRARDSRLKREVAIKLLPEVFASDAERVARLQREAEVLASLNHPNIAAIHQLDEHEGARFLVLELVEGDTLAEMILGGSKDPPLPLTPGRASALPQSSQPRGDGSLPYTGRGGSSDPPGRGLTFDQTLDIALQIAAALQAAHERGIVHRDLKPANVKVTPGGVVKVLDFGLAKIHEPPASEAALTHSPTILGRTQANVILGTAAYMSPEQARGQDVDRASDIWAFGCVLYEMLTGRPAFTGETITDILGGIVRVDPDWAALPDATPVPIRALVRRCLQKDRKRRLKDIADASLELEDARTGAAAPTVTPPAVAPVTAPPTPRSRLAWIAAGSFLLVAAASLPFAVAHLREPSREDLPIRFEVPMPEKVNFAGAPPAVSPDGRRLVFVAVLGGRTQLWIRHLDSTVAQPLAGTDGADQPFWSPDSRSIAFFADGKLRRIDASGGPPQTLSDWPVARGGAWGRDGDILVGTAAGPLYRVAASGGAVSTPATVVDLQAGELSHRNPTFLPDGRRFLFFVQGVENKQGIHVGSLDAKEHRLLLNTNASGAYAEPGHILFVRERTLVAQRFNVDGVTLIGEAFAIAEQVGGYNNFSGTFSVAANGVLVHTSGIGGVGSDRRLTWFDRTGKVIERVGSPMPIADVALSPDEKRAAVQWSANDIRVVDLVRGGVPSRLTFNASIEDFPVWSPGGDRILYTSTAGGGQNVYSKLSSGAGSEEEVLKATTVKRPTDWSRDGRFMAYEEDGQASQSDLWVLPLSGDKKQVLYLRTPFSEQQGRFSPDGKWMAYVSNESGATEVYVQSFPPSGGRWQVSTNGGVTPRWRRDGRELFYLATDRNIMSVEVKASGSAFEYGSAKPLFEAPVDAVNTTATNRYDVSADGKRFLVNASAAEAASVPITVVVNWLAGVGSGR